MDEVLSIVEEYLNDNFSIVTAVAVVLATIVLAWVIFGKRSRKGTVLIAGLCDSGKTSLFTLLTTGEFKSTHTSIIPNETQYTSPKSKTGRSLLLVDTPGHQRIRNQMIEQYSNLVGSIIFMIDSSNFSKELRDVAECLYDVLGTKAFSKSRCPLLICCNKQDIPTARAKAVIKSQLATEINALRKTRSAALLGTDDQSSSHQIFIGKKDKAFEFEQMMPMRVEFVECSVKGEQGKPDVDDIISWIGQV